MNRSTYYFDEHDTVRIIKDDCVKSLLEFKQFSQFDYHRIVYEYLNDEGEWIERKIRISPKAEYEMKNNRR